MNQEVIDAREEQRQEESKQAEFPIKGLVIRRFHTRPDVHPFDQIEWTTRSAKITNEQGQVIFEQQDVEVPQSWSQLATDIAVSKYFRKSGVPGGGAETSVKQLVHRVAHTIRVAGEEDGYFASKEDADAFEAELTYLLVTQRGAFNSPVWFNCGLYHEYGIVGGGGNWYWDKEQGKPVQTENNYEHPQCSACFIQGVEDSLDSMTELQRAEVMVFKYGSGSGTNFSKIRAKGEPLSGGGESSGVLSFLEGFDRWAGSIKSGGTTRRAAKMVCLDMDHPEIVDFINWKVREEKKVAALVAAGYSADFNGEAYRTVSGQNSNNSVRIPDEFMLAYMADGEWHTRYRTSGKVAATYRARDLMRQIAEAAWACADPGVQFDTTINDWHTCPNSGRINASNPCSEFMFLDDSACNLASINLTKYLDADGNFDIEGFRHACRIFFIAQEILVDFSSYPTESIARNSHLYRPLGLGYANLGALLMRKGIPYDSPRAFAIAGAITAILCGHAYRTSAELAQVKGPFEGFAKNKAPMMRVMSKHRAAAYRIDPDLCPPSLLKAAQQEWDEVIRLGEEHGFRNAQATVLAPTGCLVGSSLITTDRGLVRLRTLGNPKGDRWQDVRFRVYTDEGIQEATKFYINGVAPTRRITTKGGYQIQGTPNHQIKVVDPDTGEFVWKRLGDLEPGDIVPLAMNTLIGTPRQVRLAPLGELYWTSDHTTHVPEVMTPELAELVGYFMGDGSLHSKGLRFYVSVQDDDVIEHLCVLIESLFGLPVHRRQATGYMELSVNSVPLALWWEACGFSKQDPHPGHTGKGYQPYIPDAVLYTNDRNIYTAFLRGLFEADGTVTNGVPSWTTTHEEFAHEIQTLLLTLGYPTTTKIDRSGWGQSDMWCLRIRNFAYNERFRKEIGFIGKRKNEAIHCEVRQTGRGDDIYLQKEFLQDLLPTDSPHRNAVFLSMKRHGAIPRQRAEEIYADTSHPHLAKALQFYYDRVQSNKDGGMQPTYDLSVPANVTYTANNFLSHNTIGLLMDCDTTGVEPDFALVKFKKLAGGGSLKIVNQSVPLALTKLGYTQRQIEEIVTYAQGTQSLEGAPHINRQSLRLKGLTDEEIHRVEKALPGAFDLRFAFNPKVLGPEVMKRLGISEEEFNSPEFDFLSTIGFTEAQIEEANRVICGTLTLEGAPHLKEEHLPVFDCASRCGPHGKRFIEPMGHIRMMAAVQPFISGSISKTINLPNESTAEDIENLFVEAWRMGLKAVAIYRDGCKLSQPLNTRSKEEQQAEERRPLRRRLPDERRSITHKFSIGGHEGYMTVGMYDDGTPGEVFLRMAKEGSVISGLMDTIATMTSVALQYGVPLETLVRKFSHVRFEPSGFTNNPQIPIAKSIVDYVFRWMGLKFLGQTDPSVEEEEASLLQDSAMALNPVEGETAASSQKPKELQARLRERERLVHSMQSDAPACYECGAIMVRNGSCYRCLNCGSTSGCS